MDGIIAETVKSALPNPNMELYRELEKLGIPVLFVNNYYKELSIPHISMDDRRAGYLAARHPYRVRAYPNRRHIQGG